MRDLILIVDDDREARECLRVRLSGSGFNSVSCGDGKQAIEYFEKLKPRLVLLDASLPDISGPEICEFIRAADPQHVTKVIFISGAASPSTDYVERCAKMSGADGFLRKPYETQQVLELADRICGGATERGAPSCYGCMEPATA